MKILIYIVLTLAGVLFLPEKHIGNIITNHYHISGDGEEAMNSLDELILLVKVLVSVFSAYMLVRLYGISCKY
jgi:hypothetical protein